MAAGKRYKFQGSEVRVLTGFTADSPPDPIGGVSRANPAVVTTTTPHSLIQGDIVKIQNVVGMIEINNDIFVVGEVLSATTFELVDTDSTDYGVWVSGGTVAKGTMSNFCELTNYNRQGGTSPELAATSLCSTAQEYELGLPDFGTTALSFNFAPRTAIQGALHDYYLSGEKIAVDVRLPNDGGDMVQLGFVQQETETAGVGTLWTATTTVRNTGNRYDIPMVVV